MIVVYIFVPPSAAFAPLKGLGIKQSARNPMSTTINIVLRTFFFISFTYPKSSSEITHKTSHDCNGQYRDHYLYGFLHCPGLSLQILFFLKKRRFQFEIFLFGTYLFAHRLERFCYLKTFLHVLTRVFSTPGTIGYSFFLAALHNAISAPVLRLAAGAGYFLICDEVIPVSDLQPELCRMTEFFFRLLIRMCDISRTSRTVISACCNYLPAHVFPRLTFLSLNDHGERITAAVKFCKAAAEIVIEFLQSRNDDSVVADAGNDL